MHLGERRKILNYATIPNSGPLLSSSPCTSVDSCCLLTMLTTQEDGAVASAPKHAEDVGVNDLGDDGAAMRALRRNQPWEAVAGGPAGAGLVLAAAGR